MKKYEFWAWINIHGIEISPHFSSKAKAIAWKKDKCFVNDNYSLYAKLREGTNENVDKL